MTDIATNLRVQPRAAVQSDGASAPPAPTQTFNPGQQVLIGSAAALAALKVWEHRFLAALQALFVRAEKTHRPKHYPNRRYFIEDAAMSREMYRL